MKKYQNPIIRYVELYDVLLSSVQNLADDLIIFDDVASEL